MPALLGCVQEDPAKPDVILATGLLGRPSSASRETVPCLFEEGEHRPGEHVGRRVNRDMRLAREKNGGS